MDYLKKETLATLSRKKYSYNWIAHLFFKAMDLITLNSHPLSKAMLLEILACIPYREWEMREYWKTTFSFRYDRDVDWAQRVIEWGRSAQDNEFWHLVLIREKMKEDLIKEAWYLLPPLTFIFTTTYMILSKLLAWINIEEAFHFNAQFEDHAEHVYAKLVQANPDWDLQSITSQKVKKYNDQITNWGDIFRQVSLDEREHRNNSFIFCHKEQYVVPYMLVDSHENGTEDI